MAIAIEVEGRSATRQTWRTRSVRDILTEIIADAPKAGEATIYKRFVEHCREDADDLEAALDYAFKNNYEALIRSRTSAEVKAQRASAAATRAVAYAEAQQRHAKAVESFKERIRLLNMEMPNGKRLRYCTGYECESFGGWLKSLGKIKTKTVGQVYNEEELRKLLDQKL